MRLTEWWKQHRISVRWLGVCGCLLVLFAGMLSAQIDQGSVVGTVTDASGAVIPGAAVTVTNKATGVAVKTVTNREGTYQVLSLNPGDYTIQVKAKGFDAAINNDVPVHVQTRAGVNFTLKVGSMQQETVVSAAEPLLQTQSANLGNVVESQQIQDLPLNGRRYSDLALLEPGVQHNLVNQNNVTPDRFSANGNSETQNYFSLDGVDNNSGSTNLQEGSVQVVQPPPDALQEFRVQTRTYTAEFGTSAGAVVNASIKSGTNQFHGDVWEFVRNNKLDANTFFNNKNGTPIGHLAQNQFGGTFGGPIIHNKTFFFTDYQGTTIRQATTIYSTVPTPLMKQGNFTELKKSLSDSVAAGQTGCVAGNIIQPNCIDPVGQKLMNLFPDPNINTAGLGTPGSWTGGSNYQYQAGVPTTNHSVDVRIDHTLNPSNQLFGRYSYYHISRQDPMWTSNPLVGNGNFATDYRIHEQSVALGWTDALTPTVVNQAHLGFNRDFAHSDPIGVKLGSSDAATYGLNGIPVGPNSSGLPPINISGLSRMGTAPWRPQYQISQVWQFLDNVNVLRGNHSFQFGYEYHQDSDNFLDIQSPQGQISTSGIYTGVSGFGAADFLLGDVSTAQFTTPLVVHNYVPGHAFYGQDSWRVTPDLTLTYGLRYELFAPPLNRQSQVSNFTPANGGGLVSSSPGQTGWYAQSQIHPDLNDFAPRFGFSYHVMKPVVLRGGYGVFYQHSNRIGSESIPELNPPYLIDGSLSQQQGSTTPVFELQNGFPASQFTPALVNLTKLQIRAQDPNQRTTYVEQASFGPEIQLSRNMVLDANWVGNWGRKEQRLRNANQGLVVGTDANGNPLVQFPYANLNSTGTAAVANGAGQHAFLEMATYDGNTDYEALEVSLRHQYTHGVGYTVNYTWSHAMSNFVDNLTGTAEPQNAYNYGLEMGNSPFDVRHRLVANAIWALPIGQGGKVLNNNSLASRLVGGWQVNTILTLQTGVPFDVTAPDQSFTGPSHASRANCIGDPFAGASTNPADIVAGGPGFFINPAAFSLAAPGTFGTCAPRMFHGPGFENLDLSLFKSFALGESRRVELRGEFFNALNHANFSNPSTSYNPANLGSFGKVFNTVGDPREVQLAVKFYF